MKEREIEANFKRLIAGQFEQDIPDAILEQEIQKWKLTKNGGETERKWKRGLVDDDAKAIRMIKKEIEKRLK